MSNTLQLPGEPPTEGRWEVNHHTTYVCYYFLVNNERKLGVNYSLRFIRQTTGVLVAPVNVYFYPQLGQVHNISFLFTPNGVWRNGLGAFSSMTTPAELFPYLWHHQNLENQQRVMLAVWAIHNCLFGSQPVEEFVVTKELKEKHLAQMKASLWHPIWQEWIDAEEKILKGM